MATKAKTKPKKKPAKAQEPKAKSNTPGLTLQQERFVAEYLIDLNATQAAIRAGYSAKTAQPQSSRLLSNAMVQTAVAAGHKRVIARAEKSAADIVAEMEKLAFSNMTHFTSKRDDGELMIDFSGATEDQLAAITEYTTETYTEGRGDDAQQVKRVKFKIHDKYAPLVKLGERAGAFKEASNAPVIINYTPAQQGAL